MAANKKPADSNINRFIWKKGDIVIHPPKSTPKPKKK